MARFLLGQNYRFILSGYEPRLVETFEFCTKIKIQNSVPNSKNGRSVTYVYVDYDNVKTTVQHNSFNGWYCILYCGKGCQTSKVKPSPKNRDHAHFWGRFKDNYFMRSAGQLGSLDIFIKYLT